MPSVLRRPEPALAPARSQRRRRIPLPRSATARRAGCREEASIATDACIRPHRDPHRRVIGSRRLGIVRMPRARPRLVLAVKCSCHFARVQATYSNRSASRSAASRALAAQELEQPIRVARRLADARPSPCRRARCARTDGSAITVRDWAGCAAPAPAPRPCRTRAPSPCGWS